MTGVTPRPKAKKRRKKAIYMEQADKAFSLLVRHRDGRCQRCRATENLQCAHIVSRSYKSVRTNFYNAIALCRGCHTFFTHRPLEWEAWINKEFDGRFDQMREQALRNQETGTRMDWEAEAYDLRQLVKERGIQ